MGSKLSALSDPHDDGRGKDCQTDGFDANQDHNEDHHEDPGDQGLYDDQLHGQSDSEMYQWHSCSSGEDQDPDPSASTDDVVSRRRSNRRTSSNCNVLVSLCDLTDEEESLTAPATDLVQQRFVKRGKNPSDDPCAVCDAVISNKSRIVRNGNIVSASDKVWGELLVEYGFQKSKRALHSFVSCNKYNVKDKLGLVTVREVLQPTALVAAESSDEITDDNSALRKPTSKFKVFVSKEVWLQIKPEEIIYSRNQAEPGRIQKERSYLVLRPGMWTDVFANLIYRAKKYPCSWSFKGNSVSKTGESEYWLKVTGKCVFAECAASILISHPNKPTPFPERDGLELDVSVWGDGRKIDHSTVRKRRLAGKKRREKSIEMVDHGITATSIRKKFANEVMDIFDSYPAHLPSNEVFRKAKSEAVKSRRLHEDTLQSLLLMKHSNLHRNNIYDLGMDPFFVHFWTVNQLRLYNRYSERFYSRIVIDATGKVVHKLQRPGRSTSGHIFLYSIVITVPGKGEGQVPVCQMLSERHNASALTFWFHEWLRSGADVPREIILDDSPALISAATRAFAGYSSSSAYMDSCMRFIMGDESSRPPCIVRLDVAHLTNLVRRWKCIVTLKPRQKEFFIRAVVLVAQSQSLREASTILRALFTTASSSTEGTSRATGDLSMCEVQKTFLKNLMSGQGTEINSISVDDSCEPEELGQSKLAQSWVENICEEVKANLVDDGDHDNLMYEPEVMETVRKFCYSLPLWCAAFARAMDSPFERGVGASVESEFNNLKNRLIRSTVRCDDFLLYYFNFVEGAVKLASTLESMRDEMKLSETESVASTCMTSETTEESRKDKEHHIPRAVPSPVMSDSPTSSASEDTPPRANVTALNNSHTCMACKRGDLPTGAHVCIECKTNVHILEGCSVPIKGESEGYGERRICVKCMNKTDTNSVLTLRKPSFGDNAQGGISSIATPKIQESQCCKVCKKAGGGGGFDVCLQCKGLVHTNEKCSSPSRGKRYGAKSRHICNFCSPAPPHKADSTSELSKVEDWRGLTSRSRNTKKAYYWTPNPDLPLIPDDVQKNKVGVLRNGSCGKLRAVKIGNTQISVINSCSFDAPLQLITCAYTDSALYRQYVDDLYTDGTILQVVKYFATKGVNTGIYRLRANVLQQHLNAHPLKSGLTCINCLMSASEMLKQVGIPSSCKDKYVCNSPYCPDPHSVRHVAIVSPSLELIEENGIENLEAALEAGNPEETLCSLPFKPETLPNIPLGYQINDPGTSRNILCAGIKTLQREPGSHLMVELTGVHERLHTEDPSVGVLDPLRYALADIPVQVKFGGVDLILRGAVVFIPPVAADSDAGHYTACCRRLDNSWELYDDMKEKMQIVKRTRVVPLHMLMYTI